MALIATDEHAFLFACDLVDYIMVDNDIEWEPNFRTEENETKFTADIALAVIKLAEKKYLDIRQKFDEMKNTPVETAHEFSQYMTEFAESIFQEGSSCVKYFTFCAYVTSLAVLYEKSGVRGFANAAVYVIGEVLEGQLSEYFRSGSIWETLLREAEKCIITETKFSFVVGLVSHVMIMEGVEWETSLEACDPEIEFSKVVRTMDKIRTKRYSEIIQEFNNIHGTSVKTKDEFSDYIKELAKSYFKDTFDSLKFLNYCAHVGLLAVLSEKNEIKDSADAVVYAIVEVLDTQELKSDEFWEAMRKAALSYQEAETNLSFAISLMSHVMKRKNVEWKTSFEVCDTESNFTRVVGTTVDFFEKDNYHEIRNEFRKVSKKTKDQFEDHVKKKVKSYFLRGYTSLQYLSYCSYVANLAVLFEMNGMSGSADITVQIMADVLGKVLPEEMKGLKVWEELYGIAEYYNQLMETAEDHKSQAKRQKTS